MYIKFVLGSLLLIFASSTQAAIIEQFTSFSTSGSTIQSDVFAFDPFDTTLGTLDRVIFNIQGQVTAIPTATQNLLQVGPFGTLQPVPYTYTLSMDMDVSSLAGFNFDFGSDAQFQFFGNAGGSETSFNHAEIFSLTAEFNDTTGLLGFAIPTISGGFTPPTTVNSSRADFEENIATASLGLQFQMLNIWNVTDTGSAAVITPNGSTGGLVTLAYDYTPSPIPVPAAIWLFGSALIGLVGISKRKTT